MTKDQDPTDPTRPKDPDLAIPTDPTAPASPVDPGDLTESDNPTGPFQERAPRTWGRGARRSLARRWRVAAVVAVVAAAVVLVAAGGLALLVRADASRLVNQADARHADGDCRAAAGSLDELGSLHHLVALDVVDSSTQGRHACAVLLDATVAQDKYDSEILAEYVAHAGARWAHAGVIRADMLLLRDESEYLSGDYFIEGEPEEAFPLLTTALEESPEESESVRGVMEAYLERFSAENASYDAMNVEVSYCETRDEHLDLLDGGWTQPELAEPVAETADVRDEWLLACAGETASTGSLAMESMELGSMTGLESSADVESLKDARSLYDEYLKDYGDEPSAEQARKSRDRIDQVIDQVRESAERAAKHERVRDKAIARADHPADGSDLQACSDGTCQVRVEEGEVLTFGGPGGPYEILLGSVKDGSAGMSLGGMLYSYANTSGSISMGDGYATWNSGPRGELTLNDKVSIGVDGVRGDRATLSVWLVD